MPLSEPKVLENEIIGGTLELNVLQTRKLVNSNALTSPFKKHSNDLVLARRNTSQ
jgi:hypothetical protein